MTDSVKLIKVRESIQADNDQHAQDLRKELKASKTLLINIMSSPGAGKTSLLLQTTGRLKDDYRMAVIEADIDSTVDAERLADSGVEAIQLQTDGFCHLDVPMVQQGLDSLDPHVLDIIFIENVGNLVCPAEFDTGAALDVMILSVPEGDDKPLKYPLMFSKCDALIVNKTDFLGTPLTDFDLELLEKRVRKLNREIRIFPLSSRTGEGIKAWTDWLANMAAEHNK
ncbi:MAG: hydrogenase nickel incorporation protein HypB [Desulfofustis sp.]|jgi:hydrogenase nickel incorporation protein HypB